MTLSIRTTVVAASRALNTQRCFTYRLSTRAAHVMPLRSTSNTTYSSTSIRSISSSCSIRSSSSIGSVRRSSSSNIVVFVVVFVLVFVVALVVILVVEFVAVFVVVFAVVS